MIKTEVKQYINQFPINVQETLNQLRELVLKHAPQAQESISYGMPAYKLNNKPLIYFAAYKNHIGLYATPSGHLEFKDALAKYKQGKGSVQFPLTEPFPFDLVEQMIVFRVKENSLKAKSK